MKQTAIFWPLLALVAWTLLVLVQIPIRRFHAYFTGRVAAADFKYGESNKVPIDVALPNRIFMNLVEVSVLFYALSIIFFVTQSVDQMVVNLAWLYFSLRIIHTLIYLTYNHVIHRFAIFAASNFVIVALLIYLTTALAR
jgi:hypothetical protein